MASEERPPLSKLTAPELLARADEYRLMAATANPMHVRDALLGLTERLEKMAEGRQRPPLARVARCD
jgi:hypothetical protein